MNEDDEYSLQQCNEKQLEAMLKEFQSRLGTRGERGRDLDLVMSIACELNEVRANVGAAGEQSQPRVIAAMNSSPEIN
jgi:hypothetical protein